MLVASTRVHPAGGPDRCGGRGPAGGDSGAGAVGGTGSGPQHGLPFEHEAAHERHVVLHRRLSGAARNAQPVLLPGPFWCGLVTAVGRDLGRRERPARGADVQRGLYAAARSRSGIHCPCAAEGNDVQVYEAREDLHVPV